MQNLVFLAIAVLLLGFSSETKQAVSQTIELELGITPVFVEGA